MSSRGFTNIYFNSRPSARGDSLETLSISRVKISIHAPPRGATERKPANCELVIFQFTPLREGRQRFAQCLKKPKEISIHAPPRGATGSKPVLHPAVHISIHAPPRGATCFRVQFKKCRTISIHAPPRGATIVLRFFIRIRVISIHAPPRGATSTHFTSRWGLFWNFNSRPSARGDVIHTPH